MARLALAQKEQAGMSEPLSSNPGICDICGEHANEHGAIAGHDFSHSPVVYPRPKDQRRIWCYTGWGLFWRVALAVISLGAQTFALGVAFERRMHW